MVAACSSAPDEAGPGHLVVTAGDGSVSLIDPETGEAELLGPGSAPGIPVQPTASPDGATVVWSGVDDGGDPYIAWYRDGGTRHIPSPTLPFYYAFSADGEQLAFLGNDPDGAGVALLAMSVDDAEPRLLEVGRPYYFDWSPDGSQLAIHVGFEFLGTLDLLDGGRADVGSRPGPFLAPAWTEDGRIVAVTGTEELTASLGNLQAAGFDLTLVSPDGGATEPIVEVVEAVAFEVAGTRLAYVEGDDGTGALRVLGLDGSGGETVADGGVATFEWSPDGTSLLYTTLVEGEPALQPHVWDGSAATAYPTYRPTATFVTQYLPFWAQYTRTITQWAPDGSGFAYAAAADGGETVMVQPLGGEPRDVGEGQMVIWAP